jgi:hypothetical protein
MAARTDQLGTLSQAAAAEHEQIACRSWSRSRLSSCILKWTTQVCFELTSTPFRASIAAILMGRDTLARSSYRKSVLLALMVLAMVLPVAAACGGETPQVTQEATSQGALSQGYGMAAVRTSTPTLAPNPTKVVEATDIPRPMGSPAPTADPAKTDPSSIPRIGVQEAKAQVEAGEALLVDVRSRASFDHQHIAGALSMPSNEVAARCGELPADKLSIFY